MTKYEDSLRAYYNTQCTHLTIKSNKLISTQAYQRYIKEKHVKEIADKFEVYRFGEPVVNYRDGNYYLVDGQHRIAVLIYMNGGEPVDVKCTVFYDMTYQEEADYFAKQDDGHMRQSGYGRIFASKEAGNPTAVGFMSANESLGLRVSDDDEFRGSRFISACATLYQMFNRYGPVTYFRVMKMILNTWRDDESQAIVSMLIKSVFLFDKKYHGEYQEKMFIHKLENTVPLTIVNTAKTIAGDQKNNIVSLLTGYYNVKLKEKNRLK